jgi:hypothetical protein
MDLNPRQAATILLVLALADCGAGKDAAHGPATYERKLPEAATGEPRGDTRPSAGTKADGRAEDRLRVIRGNLASFSLVINFYPGTDRHTGLILQAEPTHGTEYKSTYIVVPSLSSTQATRVLEILAEDGFLGRAVDVTPAYHPLQGMPERYPWYEVMVNNQVEPRIWTAADLQRLRSLRGALDGDAAKGMDEFLKQIDLR